MEVPKNIVITLNSVIVLIIFTLAVLTGIIYFAPNYLGTENIPQMKMDIEYQETAQIGGEWIAEVKVNNTGEETIEQLYIDIPEKEYIESTEGGEEKLEGGKSTNITLQSKVPEDAEAGKFNITLKLRSKKIDERTANLPVTIK